jgi:hypothetical protein
VTPTVRQAALHMIVLGLLMLRHSLRPCGTCIEIPHIYNATTSEFAPNDDDQHTRPGASILKGSLRSGFVRIGVMTDIAEQLLICEGA